MPVSSAVIMLFVVFLSHIETDWPVSSGFPVVSMRCFIGLVSSKAGIEGLTNFV